MDDFGIRNHAPPAPTTRGMFTHAAHPVLVLVVIVTPDRVACWRLAGVPLPPLAWGRV